MLVYDPQGPTRPRRSNQIGSYNADGTVNATGSIAANAVNLLAETVVLNYMALHGQAGDVRIDGLGRRRGTGPGQRLQPTDQT